ncbi:hypothetical protein [Nocardia sp. NPDC004750]
MDDTEVFGPTLFEYPFSRAIAERHLKDVRIEVISVAGSRC